MVGGIPPELAWQHLRLFEDVPVSIPGADSRPAPWLTTRSSGASTATTRCASSGSSRRRPTPGRSCSTCPTMLRELFHYRAGQFCTFRVHIDGEEHLRCYSMSSAPETDGDLTVTVKRVPGGLVSNWFHDHVSDGDVLEVTKPAGVFCVRDGDRPVVALLRRQRRHAGHVDHQERARRLATARPAALRQPRPRLGDLPRRAATSCGRVIPTASTCATTSTPTAASSTPTPIRPSSPPTSTPTSTSAARPVHGPGRVAPCSTSASTPTQISIERFVNDGQAPPHVG